VQELIARETLPERNANSVEIKLWSAKHLFDSIQGQNIDLVKIDIEGYEETVLRACKANLAHIRPRAILFEDHKRSAAPDGKIGKLFGEIGYTVVGIKKRLTRLEIMPLLTSADCTSVYYLATPS
jgi:hypothetical protein